VYSVEKLEQALEKICENGKGKMLPDYLSERAKKVLSELE